jgi:ribosomal-protein-alanine N-acetyltransferase
MRLETKRLVLRDITAKDAKDLVKTLNDIDVSKWMLNIPHPYKMKDAKKWIDKYEKDRRKNVLVRYMFGIELKNRYGIIGAVGLSKIDMFQGNANIGYWLNRNYWRQGIMQEAATCVLDYAFRKLKLRRINVDAFAGNEASNALLKKLGFKFEGMRREISKCNATGKIHDDCIYGLLKRNWKKRSQ